MQSHMFDSDHRMVVMTATFPTRKQVHRIFRRPKTPPIRPDIKQLRDDPAIQGKYGAKLDSILLGDVGKNIEMEDVEGLVRDAILRASKETIPACSKKELEKPWTCQAYQELSRKFLAEKDPVKRKSLYYQTRKMQSRIK